MTQEPIKFCKDCAHFRGSCVGAEFAKCQRPVPAGKLEGDQLISPRLAKLRTINRFCGVERKDYLDTCGQSAKYFEPRRPWWKFVLR